MLGNPNEGVFRFKRPKPVNKFNEGRHIDTGEIDPLTGERVFINPDTFIQKEVEKPKPIVKKEKLETGLCKYCFKDPCGADCCYR